MTQVSFAYLTSGNADSGSENLGDQTTASIATQAGTIVLITIGSNKPSGSVATPTVSGLSMTWTTVASAVTASGQVRTTVIRGVANGNSGALTISHGGQQEQDIYWDICQVGNVDLGGTNGSNAIVQTATSANDSSSTPSATLPAFSNISNAAFGGMYNNTFGSITVGSGYTDIHQLISSHGIDNEIQLTPNTTVNWTLGGGNARWAVVAVELKFQNSQQDEQAYFM